MAKAKDKKVTKAKTPKAPKATPAVETVDAPEKSSSVRVQNSGL